MIKAVLKFPFRVVRKLVRRVLGRTSAPTQTSKPTVDFGADPFPKAASADPFPAPASADPFPQPASTPGSIPTTVKLATQDLFPEPTSATAPAAPVAATPAPAPAEPIEAAPKAKGKKAKAEPKAAKEEPVKAKKKADVRVIAEETPNPNAMKFVCSVKVVAKGSMSFGNAVVAQDHPLGKAVFAIPGVKSVFAVNDFVTVTKDEAVSWIAIVEPLEHAIAEALSNAA